MKIKVPGFCNIGSRLKAVHFAVIEGEGNVILKKSYSMTALDGKRVLRLAFPNRETYLPAIVFHVAGLIAEFTPIRIRIECVKLDTCQKDCNKITEYMLAVDFKKT